GAAYTHDVMPVHRLVRWECGVDSAGPRGLGGQRVGRRPVALDHSRRRVRRAGGLLDTVERAYVLHEAPAQPLVPTHPIDVDSVSLCGVDAHVEGDVLTLVDTGGGRITLDLAHRVRRCAAKRDLPLARPRLLVLHHDRIALSRGRCWR